MDYTKVLEEINSATVQISSYDYKMYCVAIAGVAFSILMSVLILRLTWRISKNQEELEKKNLKLQLFEKRYALYETIVKTKTLLDLDNSSEYQLNKTLIILEELKSNNIFVELNNKFFYQSEASKFLYDQLLVLKISMIKDRFDSLYFRYTIVFFWFNDEFNKEKDNEPITDIFSRFSEKDKYILEKNYLYKEISEYKKSYDAYVKYIDESGIMKEFEKYLNIHDLEK
ncbi:MAG: hypothetical protein WC135_05915 [Bacteroidales bacterium]